MKIRVKKSQLQKVVPAPIIKTEVVREVVKEKPIIKIEQTREIVREADRTETDKLGQDIVVLKQDISDLWDKVGQIKIPEIIDYSSQLKEITDRADKQSIVLNEMPNWRALGMGIQGQIDEVKTLINNENLWDRNAITNTLTPHTPNDNLSMGSGNISTTGKIQGGELYAISGGGYVDILNPGNGIYIQANDGTKTINILDNNVFSGWYSSSSVNNFYVKLQNALNAAQFGDTARTLIVCNNTYSINPTGRTLFDGSFTATGATTNFNTFSPTLVAHADNDVLNAIYINPTFNNNGKAGVVHNAIYVNSGNVNLNSGDLITTGMGTFGQITDNDLTASLGVYTDESKQLTSIPPTSGILGYWSRTGTTLTQSNANDALDLGSGNLTTTGLGTFGTLKVSSAIAAAQTQLGYDANNYLSIRTYSNGQTDFATTGTGGGGAITFQPANGLTYFNALGVANRFFVYDYTAAGNPYLAFSAYSLSLFDPNVYSGGAVVSVGHTYGSATLKLMSYTNVFQFSNGQADTDTTINVLGTTNSGQIKWFEDEAVWQKANGSAYVPSATLSITAGTGLTAATHLIYTLLRIQGNGGAVDITANPQIAAGLDGQLLIIQGDSDVNTVKFDTGTGLALAGGVSFTMGKGDILQLIYDSGDSLWYEISRSNN